MTPTPIEKAREIALDIGAEASDAPEIIARLLAQERAEGRVECLSDVIAIINAEQIACLEDGKPFSHANCVRLKAKIRLLKNPVSESEKR